MLVTQYTLYENIWYRTPNPRKIGPTIPNTLHLFLLSCILTESDEDEDFYTDPLENLGRLNQRRPHPGLSAYQAQEVRLKAHNSNIEELVTSSQHSRTEIRGSNEEHFYSNIQNHPNRRPVVNAAGAKRRLPDRPNQPSVLKLGGNPEKSHFLYNRESGF